MRNRCGWLCWRMMRDCLMLQRTMHHPMVMMQHQLRYRHRHCHRHCRLVQKGGLLTVPAVVIVASTRPHPRNHQHMVQGKALSHQLRHSAHLPPNSPPPFLRHPRSLLCHHLLRGARHRCLLCLNGHHRVSSSSSSSSSSKDAAHSQLLHLPQR